MRRPGQREIVRVGGRKNKNEILGLTNARLIKNIHLNGDKYSRKYLSSSQEKIVDLLTLQVTSNLYVVFKQT